MTTRTRRAGRGELAHCRLLTGAESRPFAGLVVVLAALATACSVPVGVRRVDPHTVHRMLTSNVLSTGRPSGPTGNVLFQRDLVKHFADEPEDALANLHAVVADGQGEADDIFALAELSFLHGEKSGERPYYLAASVYAWAFLFPDRPEEKPSPFDPRFRLACDLYNRGVTAGFASRDRSEVELRSGTFELPFGTLEVELDPAGLRWGNRLLFHFVPVAQLEVRGLPTRHRQPGLGAPLAAGTVPLDPAQQASDLVAPRVKVPVTALLRIDRAREQLATGRVRASLELHAPSGSSSMTIGDEQVPLEVESTATLAAMLAESPVWKREVKGFLQSIETIDKASRLATLRPYRPGLIPVVFVHGTASSAGRWAQMLNELDNEPAIRDGFQFWFFSYDTGNPIAYSAMLLRESLQETVQRLDPEGKDPALRRMVVVGHSQGGLLTKTTAVESGNSFWNNVSHKPLEELDMDEHSRDLLRRALFIHPLPSVERVVFIATPHHGSYIAGSWLAHRVARWVRLPMDVAKLGTDLLIRNEEALALTGVRGIPTSVDNMTPGNPFIRTLVSLPVVPGVTAHSIIAVKGDGPVEEENDGVVDYASAHIEGVESELLVRSGHSCQSNPHTIAEVRRILLLHLAAE